MDVPQRREGCFACGKVAFFILLEIVDEPMNGRARNVLPLDISKPCSFHRLTLNREPLNFEPEYLQKELKIWNSLTYSHP